jgi:hypothetical protein
MNSTIAIHSPQGAASSAAKVNRRAGVKDGSSRVVYIPGEGWIPWAEIETQFAEAYRLWLMRKALAGILIGDGATRRQHQITEALAARAARLAPPHVSAA